MVELLLIEGLRQVEAAANHKVPPQIVLKWIKRSNLNGKLELQDRSSRPHRAFSEHVVHFSSSSTPLLLVKEPLNRDNLNEKCSNSPKAVSPKRVSEIVEPRMGGKLTGDQITR